jgi:hypothetical protein
MLSEDTILKVCTAVYSRLLWIYPRQWRHEYGGQCTQLFRDLCRDAMRSSGVPGLFLLAWHTAGDLLISATTAYVNILKETLMMRNLLTCNISSDECDRSVSRAAFIFCGVLLQVLFAYALARVNASAVEQLLGWTVSILAGLQMVVVGLMLPHLNFPKRGQYFSARDKMALCMFALMPLPLLASAFVLKLGIQLSEIQLIIALLLAIMGSMTVWVVAYCIRLGQAHNAHNVAQTQA